MIAGKLIYLIGNPIAGGGAEPEIRQSERLLMEAGYEVIPFLTTHKGEAERFTLGIAAKIAESPPEEMPIVIAAGGDGTINEVANGLAFTGIPLAILPFGTTSVLAREIGVPLNNTPAAVSYILEGKSRPASVGRLSFLDGSSRLFLLMAGIGFDGEAVFRINASVKRVSGKCAYVLSALMLLPGYQPPRLRITLIRPDESMSEVSGSMVVVSNAARYGGDFVITPDASLFERTFSVMIANPRRMTDLIRIFGAILRRKPIPSARFEKAVSVRIEGESHLQIDGDYAGTTPVMIDVVPAALHLIVRG
ncbi:MAG TPA: diacylglycerol kinase family protein [Dissulfurispiraceae bacterium]|nr:diacylglycerol kinase family protein [Dissulfurispiraceae bacterium]